MWKKRIHPGEKVAVKPTAIERSTHLATPAKKKRCKSFPLKLTQAERESLHASRLRRRIRAKIAQAADGTQVVEFTKKDLNEMYDGLGTAATFAPDKDIKRLISVQKRIFDLLDAIEEDRPKGRHRPASQSDLVFQFKVTLLDIRPPIWRRVQVRDCTLADLHEIIQIVMGWENDHLHQFLIGGVSYGPPPADGFVFDLEWEDETRVLLSEIMPQSGRQFRFIYEYDFGDDWRHEILFECYPPVEKGKYPRCLEGERACPPEDVGGPWGYAEVLDAIANPKLERHEELLEWTGEFDPEAFDPKKATRELGRG